MGVSFADELGQLLEAGGGRRLKNSEAVVVDDEADVVQALGTLFAVLGVQALHQEGLEFAHLNEAIIFVQDKLKNANT